MYEQFKAGYFYSPFKMSIYCRVLYVRTGY